VLVNHIGFGSGEPKKLHAVHCYAIFRAGSEVQRFARNRPMIINPGARIDR
jgi:hypothetical protein